MSNNYDSQNVDFKIKMSNISIKMTAVKIYVFH